jgi:hypothetical protein
MLETTAMTERSVASEKTEAATQSVVDADRIRIRAYELYEKRSGGSGDAESDWYRAEDELRTVPADVPK